MKNINSKKYFHPKNHKNRMQAKIYDEIILKTPEEKMKEYYESTN